MKNAYISSIDLTRFLGLAIGSFMLLVASAAQAADFSWNFTIKPAEAVYLGIQVGEEYKPITHSQIVTVPSGSNVQIEFYPLNGHSIQKVTENGKDITSRIQPRLSYTNVNAARTFVVTLIPGAAPTGAFDFSFPENLPAGVAPIYFLAGHYQGVWPNLPDRTYSYDVAMDESGKLDVENLDIEGVAFEPGAVTIGGKVATVNNQPILSLSGKVNVLVDGAPFSAKGTANATIQPHDIGDGLQGLEGNMNVSGKLDGSAFKKKTLEMTLPTADTVTRDWSLHLDIAKKPDAKGRERIYASAQLDLPSGERVAFAERLVKYSQKKGYNILFINGTNQTQNRKDKKTRLEIKKMLFTGDVTNPTLSSGQLSYAFLGQKGKGDITAFLSND